MLADGICCCPDTCKEEISFLKSFAATRNQLINPSVNRPSRKSMNDDHMYVCTYIHKAWPHTVYSSSRTVHIYHIVFGALICCVAAQRCIKLFIFHTKINYRFYSHSIKKHGICV